MMFLAIIDSDDSATVARLQAILPECTLVAVPLFAEIAGPKAQDGATMGGLLQLTRRQQTILPLLLRNLSNKERSHPFNFTFHRQKSCFAIAAGARLPFAKGCDRHV